MTMRLFSEELNIGSYELLLTMPITFHDVIIGKFLASIAFIAAMLVPTIAYPVFVSLMGQLDWGPVIGGYFGAILMGLILTGLTMMAVDPYWQGMVTGLLIIFALSFDAVRQMRAER